MEFGKSELIRKISKAPRTGFTTQMIKDLIDSLWRVPVSDPVITQVGHGFSVGDAIRYNGTAFVWAQADSETNAKTIGVVSRVIDDDHFSYRNEGLIDDEQFTSGNAYYLSPTTAGLIENLSSWSTGQVKQLIGHCGPDGLELEIDAGEVIEDPSALISNITTLIDNSISQAITANNEYITNLMAESASEIKYSFIITTSLASYTYETVWEVLALNERMGEFKVTVIIHDLSTDATVHLQSILGFDYINPAAEVSEQNNVITDGSVTLTLSVNASDKLEAALAGMTTNAKRIHFCFERCVLDDNDLTEAIGEIELAGETDGTAYGNIEAVGETELSASIGTSGFGNTEAVGEVEITSETEIGANAYMEAIGESEFTGEGDVDDANASTIEAVKLGFLYNAYALEKIASAGWHVSTQADMVTLSNYLGAWTLVGGILKTIGTTYWNSPNTGASNSVGFNFRGSGKRSPSTGYYEKIKEEGWFWASDMVHAFECVYNTEARSIPGVSGNNFGFPVRLVKNSTSLSHGQEGTYVGNDSKIYRTICIGTQEWLADNLKETKDNEGNDIPVVSDASWISLSTPARCSYNNDENNA